MITLDQVYQRSNQALLFSAGKLLICEKEEIRQVVSSGLYLDGVLV